MTILNWLPEFGLIGCLFVSLVFVNFRVLSVRALAPMGATLIGLLLLYFVLRPDLAFFESPLAILHSDSLSYFGRILSLCLFSVFSMGFFFHGKLSVSEKQSTTLFLLFYSIFVSALFQANHLVLFLAAALGIYFCSVNLIFIESKRNPDWVSLIRQRSVMLGVWSAVVSVIFVLGAHASGSVYISDWISTLQHNSGSESVLMLLGFSIFSASIILLELFLHAGNAPIGLGVLYFGLFLILQVFWMRLGVPFFSTAALLGKTSAQLLVSLLFGAFTLRYSINAVREKRHHQWFSSALPVVFGLGMFLVLLPADKTLPVFFSVTLSLLFTVALGSHAFLDEDYRHKGLIVVSLVALMGVPPLILGDQIYHLIHDVVLGGNWVAGVLMIFSWFVLTMAVLQRMGRVLLVRNGIKTRRRFQPGEYFFLALYLVCVIALTAFRGSLIALLNDHPISNLW
jgi:hypothetical protein